MEKLDTELKKQIIQDIINSLNKADPNLYYTDTMTVAALIVEYIQEQKLKKNEFELVKDLSRNDVQVLMSYNSNCC